MLWLSQTSTNLKHALKGLEYCHIKVLAAGPTTLIGE